MKKLYHVTLTDEERAELLAMTKKGKLSARTLTRLHILLRAADGATDLTIAEALSIDTSTVERTRKRFVELGIPAALTERPRPGAQKKLDQKAEAFLLALTCSDVPGERECWTMQLLADKLVELGQVASISDETVRRTLKKTFSSPGKKRNGASRP